MLSTTTLASIRVIRLYQGPLLEYPSHMSRPCYVVFNGRELGVYYNWPDCEEQAHRFCAACYKKYNSYEEGIAAFKSRTNSNPALAHDDDFNLQNCCNCSLLDLCLSPMEEALSSCTNYKCDG
jgi:hypothetical protein